MCKFKSAIILKDRVFMPNYNSHTSMLEELNITDNLTNAKTKFIRAEIYPESGDLFTDISTWKYHVDQDVLPDWYVAEYDESRMRNELQVWNNNRFVDYVNQKELGSLNIGEIFRIGNIEYVVLDKQDDNISCITKGFVNDSMRFDNNTNKFKKSSINNYLNTMYYGWFKDQVGEENIIKHKCEDSNCNISLLTLDQYKKYRGTIPNAGPWWWLATPCENTAFNVYIVCSDGYVRDCGCCYGDVGVRPFCILKSSILVSCR
jgi:hypothetical protein